MGLRWILLISAASVLSGCSGPLETRVTSGGPGLSGAAALVDEPDAVRPHIIATARVLALAELAKRQVTVAPGADLRVEVTASERPAAYLVTAGGDRERTVLAAPKKRRPLQSCADRELAVAVRLVRIADGAEAYVGRAAEFHCKAALAETLPHLVAAALADLAAPRGDYVVSRRGLD